MKYGFKISLLFISIMLLFAACEKEISVDLPEAEKKIVIEGVIENGEHPYIILTNSAGYFDPIGAWLDSIFITDAIVTISDGSTTDTAVFELDNEVMAPLPYLVYRAYNITGEIGGTYDLKVEAKGKTITATTTIPEPVALDSLWFQIEPGSDSDSLGFVWAKLTDPPILGNYYAWFTKTLGKDERFLKPGGYTFDDKFFNGESIEFPYGNASNPFSEAEEDSTEIAPWWYIEGQTVAIKFCTMDYSHYNFREQLEDAIDGADNPFSSPSTVPTNLSEGALGYWGGFACTYDTVTLISNEE